MQYQVNLTSPSPENLVFGTLDHSKMHFSKVWMILHDLVVVPNVGKHSVLTKYTISSRPFNPKSRKPCFWDFGSFKNVFSWLLNDPTWPGIGAECSKAWTSITTCNIKLFQLTRVQKTAKNLLFGTLDHSKMHFCDFWMIQHEQYRGLTVKIH